MLYVPNSPFSILSSTCLTRSLDCVISFIKDRLLAWPKFRTDDWHWIWVQWPLPVFCSSCLLNVWFPPHHPCSVVSSQSFQVATIGAKPLQVIQFAMWVSWSRQLGKHTRSSFPDLVCCRATSPFTLFISMFGALVVLSTSGSRYLVTSLMDILVVLGYF